MPIERKLAAIMFTDIVGYTALSAKDSTKSSELLKTQRELLKPIVEKHGGSWMKEMGDGLLLTFDSATSAVECSIAIQKSTKEIDGLNLRIGIHEGEVIKQDGDVLGDDVNVAARIEPFSAEGGVAISQKVQQAISSNKEFETKFIGTPKLKGVAQEVKVYCITSHGLPETDISKVSAKLEKESKFNIFTLTGGALAVLGIVFWIGVGVLGISFGDDMEIPSVGILMMENLGKEEEGFWSRGMTADLITKVTGAGLIRVPSLGDILKIDKNLNSKKKANNLGVRYILSHQFLLDKDGFDLWYTLEDTKNGIALFSKKISEPMDVATKMVGTIANDIVTSLKVETKVNIMEAPTANVEAYEYYLRGKNKYTFRKNTEDKKIAVELINKAIDLDKDMLLALIVLGSIYHDEGKINKAEEVYLNVLNRAKVANDKAIQAESLLKLGVLNDHWQYGYKTKAIDYFNRSIELSTEINDKNKIAWCSNYLGKHYTYSDSLKAFNYYQEAKNIFTSIDNKQGLGNVYEGLGNLYQYKNNTLSAIKYQLKAIEIFKSINLTKKLRDLHSDIAGSYMGMGDFNSAFKHGDLALGLANELKDPDPLIWILMNQSFTLVKLGRCDEALKYAKKLSNTSNKIVEQQSNRSERYTSWNMIYNANVAIWEANHCIGNYSENINSIKSFIDDSNENMKYEFTSNQLNSYLGRSYYYNKDYDKAFEKINKISFDSTIIYQHKYDDYMVKDFKFQKYLFLDLIDKELNKSNNSTERKISLKELLERVISDPYHSGPDKYEYDTNFMIFHALNEKKHLKNAYNEIQKKHSLLEKELAFKFLSYPIPKQIVEEWEKLNK